MTLTHPLAFLALQLAEEKLQLFHCDAVAGEHAQHVDEQVCKTEGRDYTHTETYRQAYNAIINSKSDLTVIKILCGRFITWIFAVKPELAAHI